MIQLGHLYQWLVNRWYSLVICISDRSIDDTAWSYWYRWPSCIIYWPVTGTDDQAVSSIDQSLVQMTKLHYLLTSHWYRWPSCIIYWPVTEPVTDTDDQSVSSIDQSLIQMTKLYHILQHGHLYQWLVNRWYSLVICISDWSIDDTAWSSVSVTGQ
jgi:hypothetical protein